MSKYPISTNEMTEDPEKKVEESALQKLLQKRPTVEEENGEANKEFRISNSFVVFSSFLESLTNRRDDGKLIVVTRGFSFPFDRKIDELFLSRNVGPMFVEILRYANLVVLRRFGQSSSIGDRCRFFSGNRETFSANSFRF